MTAKTFLFYDLETTGLGKAFDQILQYAAIRTDADFNPIDEIEYKIQLNPDIMPDPAAVITHMISPADNLDGDSEFMAVQQIHQWHNEVNTCSGGYNTLGFDDEFLRFSFYRNLLNPYAHQYANGCSRFDIFAILPFYYCFNRQALRWPKKDGKVSLKLDNLNKENQWLDGQAHEAMHDVRVTLALAKQLRGYDRKVWDYLFSFFDRGIDEQRVHQLSLVKQQGHHVFMMGVMISGMFAKYGYCRPVLGLGSHYHYKNQTLWLPMDRTYESNEEMMQAVIRKKYGEPPFILPFGKHYNKNLSEEQLKYCEENMRRIHEQEDDWFNMGQQARDYRHPELDSIDLDAALYTGGFRSRDEDAWCHDFILAPGHAKVVLLQQAPSEVLKAQAARLLVRNFPELAAEVEGVESLCEFTSESFDHRGKPKRTVDEVKAASLAMLDGNDLSTEQREKLEELIEYCNEISGIDL